MIRTSLMAKIVVSVTLVITIVLGICTYVIVHNQTRELRERAEQNGVYISDLIHQLIRQVMLSGKREEIDEFILNVEQSGEVQRAFIFDEAGEIIYSSKENDIGRKADDFHRRLFDESSDSIIFRDSEDHQILSVVKLIKNNGECHDCHQIERPILGALSLDISLTNAEKEVVKNRNWIIFFAVIILLLVSIVVWVLVALVVKRPIRNLTKTMTEVENGNLKARVEIKSKDELGGLAASFNVMISSIEQLRAELQKQHEQQMQQAEKLAAIGELASGIAHEIKNPLAGISAAIQVLSNELPLDASHQEVIDEIIQQLERLNKNTKDFLSFARPAELKFLQGDINDVIRAVEFLIQKQAEQQKISIERELDSTILKIHMDPEQMQQVFLNISLNALQAMPEGGSLSIESRVSPNPENEHLRNVVISFLDTGNGIPEEQLRKIFNPFFTTKHRGTGLGLSISQNIVEQHGGHIKVVSDVGKGTRITIVLPVKEES